MRALTVYTLFGALVVAFAGCSTDSDPGTSISSVRATFAPSDDEEFARYWYQGKAEITSYDLEQARYGAIHDGQAVTIFVTEDLSKSKQVKLDDPSKSPDDAVKVLKLNSTREFNTGIYPYSVMSSIFTPVYSDRHPKTLKVTGSIQEWCGQTFVQMNRSDDGYRLRHYSYFESEGDKDIRLDDVLLEDELWNVIRLDPGALPTGEIKILPSTTYQRFSHTEWGPRSAIATLSESPTEVGVMEFRLQYPEDGRELLIQFNKRFPHEIDYWEETSVSGWGASEKTLTTRARLKRRILIDYWTRNRPDDEVLRQELEL